ncbi:hypothetical protein V5799_011985 [Amblyomma americanum]|uniref:Retrotransposon gag domain-containing protein n=1 Tax=Amblyomma americanum TaxID=6943 RepID=A0AAQ4EFT6_AMBAM
MPETVTQTASLLPSAVFCSGAAWQRDPAIFSGTDDTDVEDWLASYERVSAYNKWDDSVKLTNVIFYLSDVANLWFRNHEADISNWAALKTSLTEVFGRLAVRKLCAEQRLRSRAQQTGERFTSYIEDVVNLCKRVNPSMSEADKNRHIMKGIEDDAFQMLVAKDPQTVSGVIGYCQSFDELRKQRLSTRRAGYQEATLSSLALPQDGALDQPLLLQRIQQFVREEVAHQLSLSACPPMPAPSLTPNLQHVIEEQVAEVLPPPPQPPLIAAPLKYADAVVRSQPSPASPVYRPPTRQFEPQQPATPP